MNGETYNYVQLVVEPPIWKICASQNWIISPGIRVKIKNLWNHHLDVVYHLPVFMATGSSDPKNHPGGSRCKYQANHRAIIQQAYMSSVHMSSFNIILFSTSNQDSTHTHVSTLHHTNVYIFTYFYIIYSICHFQNEHHELWLNGGHWLGTSPLIPPQHRVQKTTSQLHSFRSPRHGGMAFMEKKQLLPCGSQQIPSFPSPNTDSLMAIFVFCLLETSQRSACNGVTLQRAAMKFQIWKLEDHSLQHMSSDHFTLAAYLVDTSLQKTIKIQH